MKTTKTLTAIALAFSAFALAGCYGPQVQVPSGYVAKLVTTSGMTGDIIQPSMFRLNSNCVDCDRATLLEVSDRPIKEAIEVFMPKDQLKLNFDMTGTIRIPNDVKVINNIFDRIPSTPVNEGWPGTEDSSRVNIISFETVYNTYGKDVIREVSRSIVAKYTINQILENRDGIVAEISAAVREKTKGTPIEIVRMSFGAIALPEVIVNAKENGAEREEQLRAAEANRQLALKRQEIELIEADTVRLVDQKLAQGSSPVIMQQRWLKIMETLAGNQAKTVYVMPAQAFGDPSIMMPVLNKAMQ